MALASRILRYTDHQLAFCTLANSTLVSGLFTAVRVLVTARGGEALPRCVPRRVETERQGSVRRVRLPPQVLHDRHSQAKGTYSSFCLKKKRFNDEKLQLSISANHAESTQECGGTQETSTNCSHPYICPKHLPTGETEKESSKRQPLPPEHSCAGRRSVSLISDFSSVVGNNRC